MKEKIEQLMQSCGLGRLIAEIEPVSGGLMHRMFKVQTENGLFAVKCLNPEIMKRPDAKSNYAKAENLETVLEKHNLPIVTAISFNGKKMQEISGYFFYVFRWQEGRITDWNAITKEQCLKAGEILGKIHSIDSKTVAPQEPEQSNIDFRDYLQTAVKRKSIVAPLLQQNIDLLEKALLKLNEARAMLPPIRAICNDDMDPKNVIWHNGAPHVIDLECLDYGNPSSSCLNLALQWAGTVNGKFNKENLLAFFAGYLKAYDNGFREYDKLFGIAYTWVEWLEYNIRRALGLEDRSETEIRLGEEEIKNTIERISYLSSLEETICKILREELS